MSQLEFLAYAPKRATYRVVGGPRQFFVTFYRSDDLTDEQLERREVFARDVLEVKPLRRRSSKVDHARARAALEAAGSRAIAEDERLPISSARKWIVRIYYRSAGDELLCFDAGPFADVTASRVCAEHAATQVYVPDERSPAAQRRRPRAVEEMYRDAGDVPSAEKFDRAEIGADAIAQGRCRRPLRGARLVVLPSQQSKVVEICEDKVWPQHPGDEY